MTLDAISCQRKIAKKIVGKGADYVISLKGNPDNLHRQANAYFGYSLSSLASMASRDFQRPLLLSFRDTKIQLCIVHMIRNSLRFVPWKDYKFITRDLKTIYQAATEAEASAALDAFAETWDEKYPQIAKSWRRQLAEFYCNL